MASYDSSGRPAPEAGLRRRGRSVKKQGIMERRFGFDQGVRLFPEAPFEGAATKSATRVTEAGPRRGGKSARLRVLRVPRVPKIQHERGAKIAKRSVRAACAPRAL